MSSIAMTKRLLGVSAVIYLPGMYSITRPSGDSTGGPLINTGFAAVVLVVDSTATAVVDDVAAIVDRGCEV